MNRRTVSTAGFLLILTSSCASIEDEDTANHDFLECYDAIIKAEVIQQTSSDIPEIDGIVIRWPWFVVLDSKRVIKGNAPIGQITVLTVQHTYWREDLGPQKWFLRQNDRNWFNADMADGYKLSQCSESAPPDRAFLRLTAQTLEQMHADSIARNRK